MPCAEKYEVPTMIYMTNFKCSQKKLQWIGPRDVGALWHLPRVISCDLQRHSQAKATHSALSGGKLFNV